MAPMAMAMPPRLMMFESKPEPVHRDEGDQHADRQHDDRDERAAHVQQEDDADERDDEAFLEQRPASACRWPRKSARTGRRRRMIVTPSGRPAADFGDAGLDVRRSTSSAFCAVALQGDAGRHLALAVQFGDAAALVRAKLDARDVAQQYRRAACRP